jgi:6-phosphogluconate dehydrogenase
MLPAGKVTNDTIGTLSDLLSYGDCIIDGGNSYYGDSLKIADMLAAKKIHFIDMGVSGGIWGRREGFGLMFGASPEAEEMIRPFVKALAPSPDKGWIHAGPPGAGHYTKMVHNAIEYGLMQAYAEGFELLNAKKEFNIDVSAVSQAWRYGTVIRSWLLDLAAEEFEKDRKLEDVLPRVPDSGEARWAVKEGVDLSVSLPVISASLFERFSSRNISHYQHRILAVLRNAFGGHPVQREKNDD